MPVGIVFRFGRGFVVVDGEEVGVYGTYPGDLYFVVGGVVALRFAEDFDEVLVGGIGRHVALEAGTVYVGRAHFEFEVQVYIYFRIVLLVPRIYNLLY